MISFQLQSQNDGPRYLHMIRRMKSDGERVWTVYILRCADESLYTGIAKNVYARWHKHVGGKGAAYTRSHKPVAIVYQEGGFTRSEALIREARLKKLPRPRRFALTALPLPPMLVVSLLFFALSLSRAADAEVSVSSPSVHQVIVTKPLPQQACEEAGLNGCDLAYQAVIDRNGPSIDIALTLALDRKTQLTPDATTQISLTYWTDTLAQARLNVKLGEPLWVAHTELFRTKGIVYTDYHYAGLWLNREPLERLALTHTDTVYGRAAFLALTQTGWAVQKPCPSGPETFRSVIERATGFLEQYPQSEVSPAVKLELARAYETWWSLSQSSMTAEGIDLNLIRKGASQARTKALALYQALKQSGNTDLDVQNKIVKLTLRQDTGERAYICKE